MREYDVEAAIGDLVTITDGMNLGDLTEGTLSDLGQRYTSLLRVATLVKEALGHLEVALLEAMPEDTLHMEGVTVMRKRTNRWAWKDKDSGQRMREDIMHAVANRLSTDVATGEVDVMRRNVMEAAIREVFEVIPAVQTIKIKEAQRYGLSIFDYKTRDEVNTIAVALEEEPPA